MVGDSNHILVKERPRRKILKMMAIGGTALTAEVILPEKWVKPIIDTIFVPAHAQTSGVGASIGSPLFGVGVLYAGSLDYKGSLSGEECVHPPENIEVQIIMNIEPDIAAVKVFAHVYIETILEYRYLDRNPQPFYARGKSTLGLKAESIDSPEETYRGNIYDSSLYIRITEIINKDSSTSASVTVRVLNSNSKKAATNPLCSSQQSLITYSGTLRGVDTDKII